MLSRLLLLALAFLPEPTFALVLDARHAPLMAWLQRNGAVLGPIELGKSHVGAGGGAFAARAIDEDELIFSVPVSACITLYDACGDEEVGESLARLTASGQGGATVALAGFLAKEWLCEGVSGARGPYLAMLPWDATWPPEGELEQQQEHVLWWSEKQVDDLYGSAAFDDSVGLRDEVALAAKVLKGLLGASVRESYRARGEPLWNVWRVDDDIERAVRGAFVSILTRAFAQEDSDEEENRLVPLLDMLQHAEDPNVRHRTETDEKDDERVVVRARRPLAAGDELLNCYGTLAPAQFLSRFGFVPGSSVGAFVSSIKRP